MHRTITPRHRSTPWPDGVALLIAATLVVCLYLLLAWLVLLPGVFCTPDEGAKFLQLRALRWEDGRFAQDIPYPGRALDPRLLWATAEHNQGFLTIYRGKLYFQRLPLFSALVWPFYRWLGVYGLAMLPAVGAAACGILALALLPREQRRWGMWLLIALGSPLAIYATLFWEHTLAAAGGLLAMWLALQLNAPLPRVRQVLGWSAVGAVLGLSVYLRLELGIFALALLVAYGLRTPGRRWGVLLAGVVLVAVLLPYPWLHRAAFGQSTAGNTHFLWYPLVYLRTFQWRAIPELLIGPPVEGALETGWLGDLAAIVAVVVAVHSLSAARSPAVRRLQWLGLASSAVLAACFLLTSQPYYSAHGLLFTTPWALLGVTRARQVWREGGWRGQMIVLVALLGLAGYAVEMVALRGGQPAGGLEWGARFAIPFYPLLAIVAAWPLGKMGRQVKALVVIAALIGLGIGFQARGVLVMRDNQQNNAALYQALREQPEQVVVTDLWWLPLNAAPLVGQRTVAVVDTADDLAAWVAQAAASDVQQFILATNRQAPLLEQDVTLGDHTLDVTPLSTVDEISLYRVIIDIP